MNLTFALHFFRCLSNLQYLGAGENHLTSIPTEIGKYILPYLLLTASVTEKVEIHLC